MHVRRFVSVWLISSALMYGISYAWHGLLLNDLHSVPYPLPLFLVLLALVYLGIGFGLTYVLSLLEKRKRPLLHGIMVGSMIGFFIYLMAFTLGVSFTSSEAKHVVVDFAWQMAEQGIGGVMISYAYSMFRKRDEFFEKV